MARITSNPQEGKALPMTRLCREQRVSNRDVLLKTDWLSKQEILILGKCNNLLVERQSVME